MEHFLEKLNTLPQVSQLVQLVETFFQRLPVFVGFPGNRSYKFTIFLIVLQHRIIIQSPQRGLIQIYADCVPDVFGNRACRTAGGRMPVGNFYDQRTAERQL